jgi:hypothetical protein
MNCYASRERSIIIDTIREDGLTTYSRLSEEQIKAKYPSAYRTTIDEFCAWKGAQQRTPITWSETTEEFYMEMMGAVPPALWLTYGFLVGEPADHESDTGKPRYDGFKQKDGKFYTSSRPMTRAEFKREVGI